MYGEYAEISLVNLTFSDNRVKQGKTCNYLQSMYVIQTYTNEPVIHAQESA